MKKENPILEESAKLRKKAENKIDSEKLLNSEANKKNINEMNTLLHELKVHQIELEMQNDELQQGQLELKEAKQNYYEFYELAPVGYLTLDDKGTILELNLTAANLLGEDRSNLSNKSFYNYIKLEDKDRFYLHLVKLKQTKSKQSCEVIISKKDGSEFYAHLESLLIPTQNRESLKFKIVLIDITASKQAEEKIKESEDFLNRTGEISKVGGWQLVDNFTRVEWAKVTRDIHEVTEEYNPTLEDAINYYHSDDRDKVNKCVTEAIEKGKPFDFSTRLISAKGNLRMVRALGRPEMENGKCVRLSGVLQDITEQKRVEHELKNIEWLLEKEKDVSQKIDKDYTPDYGDITQLNTQRTILDNVGAGTLKNLCSDIMDLLDTSIAIYEKNGDYAYGQFDSTWCQAMDISSFRLCKTQDKQEALNCGKWLCHENCWNDSAKEAIYSQKPTDIECVGGINLYAVPIFADEELIGVINMGYGNPPSDEKNLKELAEKYHIEYEVLVDNATKYKARPPFIIENAKKRLHTLAQLIGKIVDSTQKARQIRESENKYRSLIETIQDGIWQIDENSNTTYVNKKMTELLGYSISEMMGKHLFSFMDKQGIAKATELLERRRKGIIEQHDFEFITKKGERKYLLLETTPQKDENDNYVGALAAAIDITDRKKAELALEESEKKQKEVNAKLVDTLDELKASNDELKSANQLLEDEHSQFLSILDSIPEMIYVADMNTNKILYANKHMRKIVGHDISGKLCYEAIHGETKACKSCTNKYIKETNEPYFWDYYNPILDQEFYIMNRKIKWTDQKEVRFELAIDITDRKKAEQALKEGEEKLRNIFENSTNMFYSHTPNHIFTYLSPQVKDILGYTQQEAMLKWTELTSDNPINEIGYQHTVKAIETGERQPVYELELIRKDSRKIMVEIREAPVVENGKVKSIVGSLTDITERKQAEGELKRSQERLEIMNSILRHDIVNDIVTIKSALNIFRRKRNDAMLDEIEKRVDSSMNTIQRQREQEDFINAHTGIDKYDMEKVARDVSKNYDDIKINISGSGTAFADNGIYSVFNNIIGNAIKHGKASKLEISIHSDEDFCKIRFSDNGIGIPDEYKNDVFKEGFHYGKTGHTGIGLYIVQKTIEGYEGVVTIEDNKPQGAVFIIRLRKIIER